MDRILDTFKRPVGFGRVDDFDFVLDFDVAARQYDCHDARSSNDLPLRIEGEYALEQPTPKGVDLSTGISKPRDFDPGACAEDEHSSRRESEEVDVACRYVFAERTEKI